MKVLMEFLGDYAVETFVFVLGIGLFLTIFVFGLISEDLSIYHIFKSAVESAI